MPFQKDQLDLGEAELPVRISPDFCLVCLPSGMGFVLLQTPHGFPPMDQSRSENGGFLYAQALEQTVHSSIPSLGSLRKYSHSLASRYLASIVCLGPEATLNLAYTRLAQLPRVR